MFSRLHRTCRHGELPGKLKGVAAVFVLILMIPACGTVTQTDVAADLAAAQQTLALVMEQNEELQKRLAAAVQTPEVVEIAEGAAQAQQITQQIAAGFAAIQAAAANAPTEEEAINDAVTAALEVAAPLIPQPWGALVYAVGGLALGLIRARQNRAAGRAIAASVDPIVQAANLSDAQKAAIRIKQGAAGAAIVDEAQGARTPRPF